MLKIISESYLKIISIKYKPNFLSPPLALYGTQLCKRNVLYLASGFFSSISLVSFSSLVILNARSRNMDVFSQTESVKQIIKG